MMIHHHGHYHQVTGQRFRGHQPAGHTGAGEQRNQRPMRDQVQTDAPDTSSELLPFGKHAYAGRMANQGWRSAAPAPAPQPSAETPAPVQSTEPVVNVDAVAADPKVDEARATTARRDASLTALAEGPVTINGTEISQLDGYKAVSDASWDRFNAAYANLPDAAKAAIQDQFTVVVSDFTQQPGASDQFAALDPALQQEAIWSWQAEAAQNYAQSQGALGNPADLVDLADGARQYNLARAGYLSAGGTAGQ